VLTDSGGRVALPEDCREATCMRGGLLPGHVVLRQGTSTCVLADPLILRGWVTPAPTEDQRYRVVAREAGRWHAAGSAPLTDGRFRLDALRPGTYRLEVTRTDGWTCSTELGLLETAGEHETAVAWRDPSPVSGLVRDARGRPFRKVLLQVEYEDGAPGETRCALDRDALDVISDAQGGFVARVDPGRKFRIVVHAAWQPATVELHTR
jgi:hypothetical protein